MISTTSHSSKGKEVVETSSVGPYEALYDVVQSIYNIHYDDHHLVALDPYHIPDCLDSPLPALYYLS